MKKSVFIFVLILLCILSSCSVFPLIPPNDTLEEEPVKTMFLSSETMFSDFFFDAYSSGTELEFSDFEKLRASEFRKDNILLSVNSLSVLGRELASKEKKLSLSVSSLRDRGNGLSYDLTDITYGPEKLSAVLFSSRDSSVAAFSCLADTYIELPTNTSIKNVIIGFLSSDAIGTDRFSLSRSDCRHGDSVIKDTQKITLDLSGVDLSPLFSALFECFDPLLRLSNEKEYILGNLSSPDGTGISVYFKNGKTVCADAIFTVSDTEYRANAFFDSSDTYQSAKVSFSKSTSLSKIIFSLDFFQVIDNGKKSGNFSAVCFPQELFANVDTIPSEITFYADFETNISGNRQNCTITAELGYTLYGIISSYKIPITIVTELFDGVFSSSISLSAENPEISELDARIALTMSAVESFEIPSISPETVLPVQTEDQADEFLSSFFSEFERTCPNLRYLIFKNYRNQEQSALNILTVKNEKSGETFVCQIDDLNSYSLSGSGEYLKEFTYTENGDTLIITERSGKSEYPIYISSTAKVVLEDGSLMFTEEDGTVWKLFPSDMSGYFSKPITISILLNDSRTSGEFSAYFADSNVLFDKIEFTLTDESVNFGSNEYKYDIY